MKHQTFTPNGVYYQIFPQAFSPSGSLSAIAERADYLAQLGIDGVVILPDGRKWSDAEKTSLSDAFRDVGLSLHISEEMPTGCDALHHRCRRSNWEAVPYDGGCAKDILIELAEKKSVLYLESGNLPRSVSEMGNDDLYHWESGSMLATLLLTLPCTPLLYQGQELGMTNPALTLDDLRHSEAAEWLNSPDAQRRSPAELEAKVGRFTCLNARNVPDFDHPPLPDLTGWYKDLISFRKTSQAIQNGTFSVILPEHRRAFIYERACGEEKLLIIANLTGYAAEYAPTLERGRLIFHSYQGQMNFSGILRPYEVKIFVER